MIGVSLGATLGITTGAAATGRPVPPGPAPAANLTFTTIAANLER